MINIIFIYPYAQSYIVRHAMLRLVSSANMAVITNGAMVKDNLCGFANVGKIYARLK